MKRLLDIPVRSLALYSLLIVVVMIPVFFFLVEAIWESEVDEHNRRIAKHYVEKIETLDVEDTILLEQFEFWSAWQPNISINKVAAINVPSDSVYEVWEKTPHSSEKDRFRCYQTFVSKDDLAFQIRVQTNIEEEDETLIVIGTFAFVVYLMLVIGFIILNRRISRKTWKPFYALLGQLEKFEISNPVNTQFPETGIYEFNKLNEALKKLIDHSVKSFQIQKSFTENAAHELQTPLAVLRTRLNAFVQNKNLSETQLQLVNELEAPITRLTRINKNMLLLSGIENRQYEEVQKVDLREILHQSMELMSDFLKNSGLTFSIINEDPVVVEANSFLCETVIQNLISNAIRHSEEPGIIELDMSGNKLSISNPGKTALVDSSLFTRFSGKKKTSGVGLGLSIVREVCSQYGWEIQYRFEGKHILEIQFL
ncbi:MAG: hypothetical protein GC181_07255 [Bacteroidetes bacterium]|nr:hypothetical protein [Bacteroidota bacterium]